MRDLRDEHKLFEDFCAFATGDWRRWPPTVYYVGNVPVNVSSTMCAFIFDILYKKRLSTAVPSKSRGTWEAAVENLLLRCIFDVHGMHKLLRQFKKS